MADVSYTGLANGQPALGIDVVYGGIGTPVFDGTIDVEELPSATNFDTDGKTEVLGAPNTIFPPPSLEVRNNGPVQADPNSNRAQEVELYGTGTPLFPGLARTGIPLPVEDPNLAKDIIVTIYPGRVAFPQADVTYFGPVINVSR